MVPGVNEMVQHYPENLRKPRLRINKTQYKLGMVILLKILLRWQ